MESLNILGSKLKKLKAKGDVSFHEIASIESRLTLKQSNLFLHLSMNGPASTVDLIRGLDIINIPSFAFVINKKLKSNNFNLSIQSIGARREGLWQITCEDVS